MRVGKYKRIFSILPIAVVLIFLCLSFTLAHKYYFSLTEVKVDGKKKTLSVSCKLFTDDLENALLRLNKKKIDLPSSVSDKNIQLILFNYITQRFQVSIGKQPIKLSFVGFEIEDDATWCYLESKVDLKNSKSIRINNTLFYDDLKEQTNLIQVQWDEIRKSEKLNYPAKEVTISF